MRPEEETGASFSPFSAVHFPRRMRRLSSLFPTHEGGVELEDGCYGQEQHPFCLPLEHQRGGNDHQDAREYVEPVQSLLAELHPIGRERQVAHQYACRTDGEKVRGDRRLA